jgi:hypothetical protein
LVLLDSTAESMTSNEKVSHSDPSPSARILFQDLFRKMTGILFPPE